MRAYIIRRVLLSAPIWLGAATVVFLLQHVSGDPALLLLGTEATQQQVEELRHSLGLDQPLHIQLWRFFANVFQGDLGHSIRTGESAFGLALDRLPATLLLAGAGMGIAIALAIPLGILAAIRRNTIFDSFSMLLAVTGQSLPSFWLGIMLILLLSVQFEIFPVGGYGLGKHLVLPAVVLGAQVMAQLARLTRSTMLEVLGTDYIRTARAKGLHERIVLVRHALPNAMIPVVTVLGLDLGALLAGAVITETVFGWPGIGQLAVSAISSRDYPIVQAVVLLSATGYVLVNLIVDISYGFLDPRIRYGSSA